MPITSRSEYGLRAMILLTEQVGGELLSASAIAQRAAIPVKYLEQILAELKRAGLVVSFPGARGGYRLGGSARDITAGHVIRAVDGPVAPRSCVAETTACEEPSCELQEGCTLRPLWRELGNAMTTLIDRFTLEQLAGARSIDSLEPSPDLDPADTPAPPDPPQ